MANFSKFTATTQGNVIDHNNRGKDQDHERHYSNENIAPERGHLNYNLAPEHKEMTDREFTETRVNETQHLTRANIVHSIGCVVTLPKDYDGNSKDFFNNAYQFLEKDFGRENVISANVHMDETTPHLHFMFVPVTEDNRLCAKEIVNRDYLQHFHERLQDHLRDKEPDRVINLYSKEKEHEKSLPMEQYKIQEKTNELKERLVDLRDKIGEYNNKVDTINKSYDDIERAYNYCDKVSEYCNRMGYTTIDYYTHEYWADRGQREHQEPERYNPERTEKEQNKEIDIDRDRDDRDR